MKTVVTAAYGGTGSVLTRRLAAKGHELLLIGRNGDKLAALAAEVGTAQYVVTDLTALEAVEAAVQAFGPIDGIVNCAGSILLKPAHITSEAEFQQTLDTNLKTAFVALRAGVKNMPAGGSVVLISTAAARMGYANHEAIAAAKAGVMGLALSAAATYAARNIRVNCVAPGLVETPLAARITSNEAALKASMGMHALGRIGRPEDVASMIEFLLSAENAWVTGQVFGVDGGLGTVRAK
ncbi:MAG: SDR family oxidoreductase [Acidobacteria bacterium]|nr:SDR family oxidoreductase [Acidobacteriota bacterium]